MKKKMLSLALALIMCLSLMPSAFAAESTRASKFTDVPSDAWYYNELDYAVYNGFISGTSATTFNPDGSLSRAAFVTIMGRMLGAPTSGGSTKFTDVDPDSWYAPYIAWASENGYVNGTSATTFTPNANLTVEQMSAILSNYISKSGVELSGYTASANYKDASSVSGWAVANVETMRQYGLLHIDANGNVNPRKDASRAEGAYTLVKFAQGAGLGEAPTIIQNPTTTQKPTTTGSVTYDAILYCENAMEEKGHVAAVQVHDELWASGKITSSMTQKQKARVYYDWLIQHCVYGDSLVEFDWKSICEQGGYEYGYVVEMWLDEPSFYAYGALVEGRAVCEGYARAYQALLTTESIECGLVASFGGDHMWNTAVLDGVSYHIDTTWGDKNGNENKYFCMTEDAAWARFGGKEQGPTTSGIDFEWGGQG